MAGEDGRDVLGRGKGGELLQEPQPHDAGWRREEGPGATEERDVEGCTDSPRVRERKDSSLRNITAKSFPKSSRCNYNYRLDMLHLKRSLSPFVAGEGRFQTTKKLGGKNG